MGDFSAFKIAADTLTHAQRGLEHGSFLAARSSSADHGKIRATIRFSWRKLSNQATAKQHLLAQLRAWWELVRVLALLSRGKEMWSLWGEQEGCGTWLYLQS